MSLVIDSIMNTPLVGKVRDCCVYVLEDKYSSLYIGITTNLTERFKQHRKGKCKTSSRMDLRSVKIIHTWNPPSYSWASRFERFLHTLSKRNTIDFIMDRPIWGYDIQRIVQRVPLLPYESVGDLGFFEGKAPFTIPNADQMSRLPFKDPNPKGMSCSICGKDVCDCFDF